MSVVRSIFRIDYLFVSSRFSKIISWKIQAIHQISGTANLKPGNLGQKTQSKPVTYCHKEQT